MVRRILHFAMLRAILPLIALAPCGGPAEGQVSFDFEGPVFMEPGSIIKDHSLIHHNGLYHIFYIHGDQKTFGHATSPDLRHWTLLEPVLQAGPEPWDEKMIWAPCIVDAVTETGYLLMYYTGVNNQISQQTCLAVATSPDSWTKAPTELFAPFHGDTTWTEWSEDAWSNYRDPGFLDDGELSYLVHTACTKEGLGAISLSSSADLFNWSDEGPLYIHNSWHALESPLLLKRDGRYHLFFTEENVGGISYMSSDSMTSGWNIYTRAILDGGHAVELFPVTQDKYLFSRHTSYLAPSGDLISTIRIDTLDWAEGYPAVDMIDMLSESWTILWGDAFRWQPVFGDNPAYRGEEPGSIGFEGNWWIGTYESVAGPLSYTYPGATQGDEATGAIRSDAFTISGDTIRLLVGGGFFPSSCYIALCDEATDDILFKETGRNDDRMEERFWNVAYLKGREVYLLIVDDSTRPLGHINVDGIEERPPPPQPDPEDIPGKPTRERFKDFSALSSISNPSKHAPSLSNHPNPFNPETDIVFTAVPGTPISAAIYAVTGQEIRSFHSTAGQDGRGIIRWDGRDGSGRLVASGVYLCVLRDGERIISSRKLILGR
jgi:hypothetical protein